MRERERDSDGVRGVLAETVKLPLHYNCTRGRRHAHAPLAISLNFWQQFDLWLRRADNSETEVPEIML